MSSSLLSLGLMRKADGSVSLSCSFSLDSSLVCFFYVACTTQTHQTDEWLLCVRGYGWVVRRGMGLVR